MVDAAIDQDSARTNGTSPTSEREIYFTDLVKKMLQLDFLIISMLFLIQITPINFLYF